MTGRATLLSCMLLAGCGASTPPPIAAVAVNDGIPLGALPQQTLGKGECGLFLWKTGPGARLVVVAKSGAAPFARILLDGMLVDLPRIGGGEIGQDPASRFGDGRITAALDLTIEPRRGLSDGAIVSGGSVRIDRSDGDGFVLPVSGLLACG